MSSPVSAHVTFHPDGGCSFEMHHEDGTEVRFHAETWAKASRMCQALIETRGVEEQPSERPVAQGVSTDNLADLERRLTVVEREMARMKVRHWGGS